MAYPYKKVFEEVERALFDMRSPDVEAKAQREKLDVFKNYASRKLTDDDYFAIMVKVVFYSGFRAERVKAKEQVIQGHFPDLNTVAAYGKKEITRALRDTAMIRNERKIQACVDNARVMQTLIQEHGSFRNFLFSFGQLKTLEDVLLLKETLEAKFGYLGGITVYHFMTDAGLPVLKPDRVITRIFLRLGLIEDDRQLLKTVLQGQKFAAATGLPIRYIDIVFVLYGQASATAYGITQGVCLAAPRCSACSLRQVHCRYPLDGAGATAA
jgi:DNA-3-methyladenine glycosylase I